MEWVLNIVTALASKALALLPQSPFTDVINSLSGNAAIQKGLSWLNWFIPVGRILGVLAAWVAAISAYYFVSIALRWVKAID